MKLILLSAITLIAQTALAANAPTKLLLQPLESKFITVNNRDEAVVLKNLDSALKQISGGALQLPATIGLVIPQTYDSPFFDPMAVTLVAPYQMVIEGRSKHPNFTRAVELHEFGHAIFNENLPLIFKPSPAILSVVKDAQKLLKKTASSKMKLLKRDLVSELLARKIEETNADASSPMMQEYEALINNPALLAEEEKLMTIYTNSEDTLSAFVQIVQGTTAYNEFFADVVSVVITENPQSVANALHFSNMKGINYTDRNFRLRRSKKERAEDAHNFYSLSRNFIYKYYLSSPVYKKKGKAWLINKALLAVSCGINTQGATIEKLQAEADVLVKKNPRMNLDAFVIERMNDALNDCVEKTFN